MSAGCERLRIAFLGCGAIAAAHGRRMRRFRDQVQCFYASRDPHKAGRFEEGLGGAGSFGSYEAALADGRIDVVFITTPPPSHLALTLAALRSDKDVIVEKPAFLRAADFDRVRKVQEQTGRRVLVAENYCYKPLARTLQHLLASDAIGELRFIQVNALKFERRTDWRTDAAEAGGGALFEGGVHWVDLIAHLGPVVKKARVVRAGEDGLERSSLMIFEYAGGAVGTLTHSWETPGRFGGIQLSRLSATRGSIVFESNGLFVIVFGARTRLVLPGLKDLAGYDAMLCDFIAALRSGREPLMTLDRAQNDLAMLEGADWEASAGHSVLDE